MGIALLLGDRFENSAKPRLEEFDINVAFAQSDFFMCEWVCVFIKHAPSFIQSRGLNY